MSSPLRWNEVTAVLGGTFDPPHLGHREAVMGLFENPGVRRVLVIPSGTPPFKPGATPAPHRARMTELAFAGLERAGEVRIDRRELERGQGGTKPGSTPTYTIDTLLELRREIPTLAFVTGADQLAQLHLWHRFPELLGAAHWIVLARKGSEKNEEDGEEAAMRVLRQWEGSGLIRLGRNAGEWECAAPTGGHETRLKLVSTPAPAMSSTEIRQEIARQADPERLRAALERRLLPPVLAYLMENRLYGIANPSCGS